MPIERFGANPSGPGGRALPFTKAVRAGDFVFAPSQPDDGKIIALPAATDLGERHQAGQSSIQRLGDQRGQQLALGKRTPETVGAQQDHVVPGQSRTCDGIGTGRRVALSTYTCTKRPIAAGSASWLRNSPIR